ncbi:MAG TPA: histidine kinase [Acidimicrobiales bacterium]|nr:histidine kinase [Acidimicrobiales bacterium]
MGLVVLIAVTTSLTKPRPGLSGDRLGILLALVGIVLAVAAMLRGPQHVVARCGFLALLVSCSAILVWLQPNGPGYLAAFLAAAIGAFNLPLPLGTAVTATALLAMTLASALQGGSWLGSVATKALGVVAFYLFALLARRLREEQDETQRLLLELERSQQAQAEAAALAERQRLAREMHDVLAHSLSGLVLQLEGARLLATQQDVDRSKLAETVDRAHRLAKAGLEEARGAIGLLRDDSLPGPERLEGLARFFAADTGTPCSLEITGSERPLTSEARLTIYRVAQEALTNVRKHTVATNVEMRLSYESDGTRLVVEDFGVNGDASVDGAAHGYGLTGMRERAELLGGELNAAKTGSGFRVELWVPL